LIDGITAGNQSTAAAYIADISAPEERAKNFGLIGVSWGVGLIIGPAVGAILGQIRLEAPAYTAALLSLVSLALGFFWLPESLSRDQRETALIRGAELNPFVSIGEIARKAGLGHLLLTLCLFNLAFNGINSTQTLFLIEKFGAQPWQLGVLLVSVGITVAGVQALLVQRVVRRFSERVAAIASLFGQGISALVIFFVPILWLIYLLAILSSSMSTFTFPTIGTLASNSVSKREQGLLMGVMTALGSLMSILGPLYAGLAYDRVMLGAPYWMGTILFVLAAFFLL
jgi:MFS transporter, DHA1 family, tetracycline resistance protein